MPPENKPEDLAKIIKEDKKGAKKHISHDGLTREEQNKLIDDLLKKINYLPNHNSISSNTGYENETS